MLKAFVILFLLAAVILGTACRTTPTPTPTLTLSLPTPTSIVTPTPTPTAIPSPTPAEIPQSEFIPMLRQVSDPFDKFYGNEIEPLNVTIRWFYDPNQVLTLAHTAPCPDFKCANITLSHIPSAADGNASLETDAYIVAHELASLAMAPKLQNNEVLHCDNEQLLGRFLDMLRTPLRDHLLATYGFDLENDFQSDLGGFTSFCNNPTDSVNVNIGAFIYAKLVLYWQYVLGHDGIPLGLDSFCQRCCPQWGQEGSGILAMISEIGDLGNITPDKAHALYQQVIGNYSVSCWVTESK